MFPRAMQADLTKRVSRGGLQSRPKFVAAKVGAMAAIVGLLAILAGASSERADAAYWAPANQYGLVQYQSAGLTATCSTQFWTNRTKTWTISFVTNLYGPGFPGSGNVEMKYGAQAGSSWYGLYGPYTVFNYSSPPSLTWTVPDTRPGVSVRAVANFALWFNGVRYEQPQENAAIYAEYLNGMTKFYGGGHQGCWLY